jgi:hypothetical protein
VTTSPYGYRVRTGGQFGTAGTSPISAVYARRVLLNNLCHYADVFGQVRAAWNTSPRVGKGYIDSITPTAVDTPYPIWSTTFPILLRASLASYKLRVRIAGASSDGANAVRFRAVLAPATVLSARVLDAADHVFLTATTTSSSAAWLTGASQGAEAYTTMMALTDGAVTDALTLTSTPADIGGAGRGVAQCLVTLAVYGQTANIAATPRLHGVYAAEWVGD